jgi:hypothetical protein
MLFLCVRMPIIRQQCIWFRKKEKCEKVTLRSPALVCKCLENSLKHMTNSYLSQKPSVLLHVEGGSYCSGKTGAPGSEVKNPEL